MQVDIPKRMRTVVGRRFTLWAGRGAEGCLLYMSGAAGPSPGGCEAVRADSLRVLVVHPDAQCGDCKEGPLCVRPLGQGGRTPRVQADVYALGSKAAVEHKGRDVECCKGLARDGVKKTQIL